MNQTYAQYANSNKYKYGNPFEQEDVVLQKPKMLQEQTPIVPQQMQSQEDATPKPITNVKDPDPANEATKGAMQGAMTGNVYAAAIGGTLGYLSARAQAKENRRQKAIEIAYNAQKEQANSAGKKGEIYNNYALNMARQMGGLA